MSAILTNFSNIKVTNRYNAELLHQVREKIEKRLYLKSFHGSKPSEISKNAVHRICFTAGLATEGVRSLADLESIKTNESTGTLHETVFSVGNRSVLWSALIKLRYVPTGVDLEKNNLANFRRAVSYEIERGADFLLKDNNLNEWLENEHLSFSAVARSLPELKLHLGGYEDDTEARLDYNSTAIPNTQTLITGTSGSGKSNLLSVLINEIRMRSIETPFPVNFLLFDYKSEFSAPENEAWLDHFGIDGKSILNPAKAPLPINPFEDLSNASETEINLYSTDLANALLAIDRTSISANMGNRLAEAIIDAYQETKKSPIYFDLILKKYNDKRTEKDREKDDSITSILKQLIRSRLFSDEDQANLVNESFIVNMQGFPSDGPLAKAIVYFLVAKMNYYFKKLPPQHKTKNLVQLRHFTIIDEAHNMLDFDNQPLRKLVAEGRSKGLSVILATQNMSHFRSDHFDFYANAYYPLIMKQQSINDAVLKDLFGVSGAALQEIRETISNLQLGELIVKNNDAVLLGIGKRYKKIKVRHLI